MTPERWQTIERLYQATLERSPSERVAFSLPRQWTDRGRELAYLSSASG